MKVKNQYLKILEYLHLSFNKWPSIQYTFWVYLVGRKRATKPLLNQRQRQKRLTWAVEKNNWTVAQWSKVLFSDESTFCISFGNQGPRVWRKSGEAQNPCCLKSSVKFPQSVMIWAAMSSAGVGPLCFLKSTVNAAIYQEILEHFMLPYPSSFLPEGRKMAARLDAAAAPGPKDGAFMSFNVVCSSPNSVNQPLTHKEKHIYDRRSLLDIGERVQTPTFAGGYWEATRPLFTAGAGPRDRGLAYWRYPHKAASQAVWERTEAR